MKPKTPPVSASEDDSDEDSVTAVAITHVVTFINAWAAQSNIITKRHWPASLMLKI